MFNRKKRIIELEAKLQELTIRFDYMEKDVHRNLDRYKATMDRVGGHLVGRCPECKSDNFMQLTSDTVARCFDCGYPLMQSSSRMTDIRHA